MEEPGLPLVDHTSLKRSKPGLLDSKSIHINDKLWKTRGSRLHIPTPLRPGLVQDSATECKNEINLILSIICNEKKRHT